MPSATTYSEIGAETPLTVVPPLMMLAALGSALRGAPMMMIDVTAGWAWTHARARVPSHRSW
jgi:hypothetical protein